MIDAGLGVAGLLRRPVTGRVVSVHRRAAYLRLDGELVALVAPGVVPGPLHVRCSDLPSLRAGEAVSGDGEVLAGGRWAVRGPGAVWRGAWPDQVAVVGDDDPAAVPGPTVPDPPLLDPAVAGPAGRFAEGAGFGGLEELAAAVGGRGPGLTPSGDDLLAGVLLVARIAGVAEDRLVALVAGIPTTEVARAFLAWAARGQSIAPAHDRLVALATGDREGARRALARLHATGADSGRHLAAGLALGAARVGAWHARRCPQLPRVASQIARAGTSP